MKGFTVVMTHTQVSSQLGRFLCVNVRGAPGISPGDTCDLERRTELFLISSMSSWASGFSNPPSDLGIDSDEELIRCWNKYEVEGGAANAVPAPKSLMMSLETKILNTRNPELGIWLLI